MKANSVRLLTLFFVFASVFSLMACDRSAPPNYRGKRCAVDHDPIPLNPQSQSGGSSYNKIGVEIGDTQTAPEELLPPGDYQLRSADVFYRNQNSQIMIHYKNISSPQAASGELTESRCVSGFKPEMDSFAIAIPGIKKMSFSEDGEFTDIELAEFGFFYNGKDLNSVFTEIRREGIDHPSKLYDQYSKPEIRFFKVTDKDQEPHYQIRSQVTLSPGVEVSLLVRLEPKTQH